MLVKWTGWEEPTWEPRARILESATLKVRQEIRHAVRYARQSKPVVVESLGADGASSDSDSDDEVADTTNDVDVTGTTYTVGAVDAPDCGLTVDVPDMVTQLEAVVWMH